MLKRYTFFHSGLFQHFFFIRLCLKCHRIFYNGSVTEYTNLFIFSDMCLHWDFHYNIFKYTCFTVYIPQHLVFMYILRHFLYQNYTWDVIIFSPAQVMVQCTGRRQVILLQFSSIMGTFALLLIFFTDCIKWQLKFL